MKKTSLVLFLLFLIARVTIPQRHDAGGKDTTQFRIKPYVVASGGVSYPGADNFGDNRYQVGSSRDSYDYASGFASNGKMFSIIGGVKLARGWEITGIFAAYSYAWDAAGFQQENAAFIDPSIILAFNNNYYFLKMYNVQTTGTYYYTGHSFIIGGGKSWHFGRFSFGVNLLFGILLISQPAIHSTATIISAKIYNKPDTGQYYWDINSYSESNLMVNFGIHIDYKIWHNFFARITGSLEFSAYSQEYATFQFSDLSGNILYSNQLNQVLGGPNTGQLDINLGIGNANLTLGIGYQF